MKTTLPCCPLLLGRRSLRFFLCLFPISIVDSSDQARFHNLIPFLCPTASDPTELCYCAARNAALLHCITQFHGKDMEIGEKISPHRSSSTSTTDYTLLTLSIVFFITSILPASLFPYSLSLSLISPLPRIPESPPLLDSARSLPSPRHSIPSPSLSSLSASMPIQRWCQQAMNDQRDRQLIAILKTIFPIQWGFLAISANSYSTPRQLDPDWILHLPLCVAASCRMLLRLCDSDQLYNGLWDGSLPLLLLVHTKVERERALMIAR